jgi:hypothetical protein
MEQNKTEKRTSYGLLNFMFWVPMQTILIVIQERLGLLPSRLATALGWKAIYPDPFHHAFIFDDYTTLCGFIGCAYTAVGCVQLSAYGLNTIRWWKGFLLWYMAYIPLTMVFIPIIGSLILDVWLAPIVWLGELELVYWIKSKSAHFTFQRT